MLAAATLALAADPGPRAPAEDHGPAVPLFGVVVSYCLSSVVLLLLLGCLAAGRPLVALEAATVAALMLLTFVRTLVWAADGARLTRRVLRTDAWFRTLVHDTADVTIVLDGSGRSPGRPWRRRCPRGCPATSRAGRCATSCTPTTGTSSTGPWTAAERRGPSADRRNPVVRLRGRDGSWRAFESVRTAPSAGLPGGSDAAAPRATVWCCTCGTSPGSAAPS